MKGIMSVKNRYEFTKRYYRNCVILILIKRKLYIYKNNVLVDFKMINELKKLHIDYIIIDNLEIIYNKYEDNRYLEYYLKYKIDGILNNVLDKFRKDMIE